MAVGWVAMLQMVPWGEVIKNAPKVADGAVKLWNSVSKKQPVEDSSDVTDVIVGNDSANVEKLRQQLQAAEHAIAELQGEMVQSTEVIKELAKQNAQLVAQIEANRKAVTVLGIVLALTVLGAVVQAVFVFGA
jgi:TolA-binding protein